jgi:protein SCO1
VARASRLVVLVAALLAAAAGSAAAGPHRFAGEPWPGATKAPDFALRDESGRVVRLSAQRGRFVVVAFLYTRCADVCPLIATQLNAVLTSLPATQRRRVEIDAVSVDPNGDTRAAVQRYARAHGLLPQFHYLIGSLGRLAPVWHAYRVAVQPGAVGSVDHIAYELLVDPSGRGRVTYGSSVTSRAVLHDLRVLGLGR